MGEQKWHRCRALLGRLAALRQQGRLSAGDLAVRQAWWRRAGARWPAQPRREMRGPLVAGGTEISPAEAIQDPRLIHHRVKSAPYWPPPIGSRVHVEGHGEGNYAGFEFRILSPGVAHTIDFDEGGEKILVSASSCRDSCWWCRGRRDLSSSAARPVARGWRVINNLGSVQVSTLMAPDELQTIALTPANMSMCEFRAEVALRFGVPPEQQQLVVRGDGGDRGTAERSGSTDGELVGQGRANPSMTVWAAGVRAGMSLLLVVGEASLGGEAASVERVLELRRERLELEVARAKAQVTAVGGGTCGRACGSIVGMSFACIIMGAIISVGIMITYPPSTWGSTLIYLTVVVVGVVVAFSPPVDIVKILFGGIFAGAVGSFIGCWFIGNIGLSMVGAVGIISAGGLIGGGIAGGRGSKTILRPFGTSTEAVAKSLAAALEGRDYVPPPHTRGWMGS